MYGINKIISSYCSTLTLTSHLYLENQYGLSLRDKVNQNANVHSIVLIFIFFTLIQYLSIVTLTSNQLKIK